MSVSRLSILKFLELALTCACVALHYQSYEYYLDAEANILVTGTFVGYLIILTGAAAGYVLQTPTHKRIDIFYSLVGITLFVASGAVLIDRFQHYGKSEIRDKNLTKAALAIINGAVLLIDVMLTDGSLFIKK